MALVESAGAAWAISSGTAQTVTSGTVTPAAGDLIVAIIAAGNGNGGTNTVMTVTTTIGGTASAFSSLKAVLASSSSGGAWVYVADAGSAPTAGTVTATATGTVQDIGIIVRRFAGAKPVSGQTGATASLGPGSSVATLSITPQASGSQVVGADGQDGTVAFVANAATTIYNQTNGGAGDEFCSLKGASLTTGGVAQVLGFTSAVSQNALVLVEILAAPSGGVGMLPQPGGLTWQRRYRRPQQIPPAYQPTAAVPVPLTWQSQPARARIAQPPRGRVQSRSGVYSGQGPPVIPLSHPVRSWWPLQRKPRKGHGGRAGAPWSGQGPPLTPPSHPVQAHQRQHPRAGRVVATAGPWSGQGPPVVPLHQPVRDPLPPVLPARRGRIAAATTGPWSGQGPPVPPLHQPARSRPQQPGRGRAQWQQGVWASSAAPTSGPPVYPWQHPVTARPPLPPRGRTASRSGVFSGQGPAFTPPHCPARSRPQQPRRGRAAWQQGTWAASGAPTSGPPIYPLQHPVQAQRPPARGGRCASRRGVFSGTGPPIRPLCQPVRDPLPPTAPLRRGHGGKMAGPWSGQGPAFPAPHQPVRAKVRKLPQRGRAAGFVTQSPFVPPVALQNATSTALITAGDTSATAITETASVNPQVTAPAHGATVTGQPPGATVTDGGSTTPTVSDG